MEQVELNLADSQLHLCINWHLETTDAQTASLQPETGTRNVRPMTATREMSVRVIPMMVD